MEIITSVTLSELGQIITAAVKEGLNSFQLPAKPEQEDRIGIDVACRITGYSKATIYKMTFTEEIPFQKFGKRLVFSRQELSEWIDNRTFRKQSTEEIITDHLRIAANRRRAS